MNKLTYKILGALILLTISGCKDNKTEIPPSNIEYIKYGTSFGECFGYCVNDITITDSNIVFHKSSWGNDSSFPDIEKTETIDKYYWTTLSNKVNFYAFAQLFKTIGCPDCADGGAEWIEIKTEGEIHKVTFEYYNEPDEIKEYIKYLRTYLSAFDINKNQNIDFNNRTVIDQQGIIKAFASSRGYYQYLIGNPTITDTVYYYNKYLSSEYQINNLQIEYCGVLQYDSMLIYKPSATDVPIPDFTARNIKTLYVKKR